MGSWILSAEIWAIEKNCWTIPLSGFVFKIFLWPWAELQNVYSFTRSKTFKPNFTPRKACKLQQFRHLIFNFAFSTKLFTPNFPIFLHGYNILSVISVTFATLAMGYPKGSRKLYWPCKAIEKNYCWQCYFLGNGEGHVSVWYHCVRPSANLESVT